MLDLLHVLLGIALASVAGALGLGIYSLIRGGDFARQWSNRLMRVRVALQFTAILVLAAAYWWGIAAIEATSLVTLNRIYTRAGDGGATRLASGASVSKTDPRVEAYGGVDETNAAIGLARLSTAADKRLDPILQRVQNDLFDLGADLATPSGDGDQTKLRILAGQVARLEAEIDALNERLPPLASFVLPGGSSAAAGLHVARTVCRRAERACVALAERDRVNPEAIKYLNRLSDLLFVAARAANDDGRGDVLWAPGATR